MPQQESDGLSYYTQKLQYIGARLRTLSLFISFILLLNIVSFVVFAASIDRKSNYSEYHYNSYWYLFSLIVPILAIFTLFIFNTIKKQGMTYYEEIADEISWGKKREEYSERPPIEIRIIIKDFLKSTDLPFTYGPAGQAIYLAFFFLMAILSVMVKVTVLS